jgi:hypothetical protein
MPRAFVVAAILRATFPTQAQSSAPQRQPRRASQPAQTLDPYGVEPDLPEEYQQVGRNYFARSPGSDVWVWFGDLPDETRNALWGRHSKKLAFPAGLEESFAEVGDGN